MMGKILVADDDIRVNKLLQDIFTLEGYEVVSAENGLEVLDILEKDNTILLVILDVMMPELNGWDVLEYVKEHYDVKVLMLTALDNEASEVRGLRGGADDYVAKPFRRAALLERVKRLIQDKLQQNSVEYQIDGLRISQKSCRVYRDKEELKLTIKEYQLLLLLVENCNIVLERERILERIWGVEYDGGDRTLDTHIKMLRKSLGEYGSCIRTVRGIGYCFDGEVVRG